MNSPMAALAWEIWQRGRRSAWIVLGIVSLCAIVNLGILDNLHITKSVRQSFTPFFGFLMVVSFLLLMSVVNYTEINSAKDWNGFPYRLFVLPLRTWQLVALPMFLSVVSAELVYFAWIKLVWTHEQILIPEWFAVVLGMYVIFYQTTLWMLSGLRITRMVALSFGGVTSFIVISLPFLAKETPSPWLSERRLIGLVVGMAAIAFLFSWATVARQRSGGGRRRSWIKMLLSRIMDAMPRRSKDFDSPAAAQFWFEWRRTGWLLPVSIAFLLAIIAPASWFLRDDPRFTNYVFGRLLLTPVLLAFAIGKGFIKCEFWSTNLALPTFVAVKPLCSDEFVITKMKVAALGVTITWLLVFGFLALWLPLWANTELLLMPLFQLLMFFPHSWQMILVLSLAAFVVLTWRCMVGGMWVGLSGNRFYYIGSLCLQVLVPTLILLASAIWSDAIDVQLGENQVRFIPLVFSIIGWLLAIAVIGKIWFAVFAWNKINPRRTRQYLVIWLAGTLAFAAFAIFFKLPIRTNLYRLTHLFVLGALLFFPLARVGFAPLSLSRNRHR